MSGPSGESPGPLVLTEAAVRTCAAAIDPGAFSTNPWAYGPTTRRQAQDAALALAQTVLLAACPVLLLEKDVLARGWDKGWVAGFDDHDELARPNSTGSLTTNPWRSPGQSLATHPSRSRQA